MDLASPIWHWIWMFSGVFVRLMIFLLSSINKPFIDILGSPGPEGTSIDDFESHSIKNHMGERVTQCSAKPTQKPTLSSLSETKCRSWVA